MSEDSTLVLQSLNNLIAYKNRQLDAKLQEVALETKIKASEEADLLSHNRALARTDYSQKLQDAQKEYNDTQSRLKTSFNDAQELEYLSNELASVSGANKTDDADAILTNYKDITWDKINTTSNEIKNKSNYLEQLQAATAANEAEINKLNLMKQHLQPQIEFAQEIEDKAQEDFNILNDDFSKDGLMKQFKERFVDYTVNDDGTLSPIWNTKFQAFMNSVPDMDERRKIQKELQPLLNAQIDGVQKIIKNKQEVEKDRVESYGNFNKSINKYFTALLTEFPDMNDVKWFDHMESKGAYFDDNAALFNFSGELKSALSTDKYESVEHLSTLQEKVGDAIIYLAESGVSGQTTNDKLDEWIANRDIDALLNYFHIPLNSPDRNGAASGKSQGHSGGFRNKESLESLRDELGGKDIEIYDSWSELDLHKGNYDALESEKALVAYADMYRALDDMKVFYTVIEETRDLYGDEVVSEMKKSLGAEWSKTLEPADSDFFHKYAKKWEELHDNMVGNKQGKVDAGDLEVDNMNVLKRMANGMNASTSQIDTTRVDSNFDSNVLDIIYDKAPNNTRRAAKNMSMSKFKSKEKYQSENQELFDSLNQFELKFNRD